MDFFSYGVEDFNIPKCIWEADKKIYKIITSQANFYHFLVPQYSPDAYQKFIESGTQPTFTYRPYDSGSDITEPLSKLEFDKEHPLGIELEKLIQSMNVWTRALRERTQEAFHQLNLHCQWYNSTLRLEEAMLSDITPGSGSFFCGAPWPNKHHYLAPRDGDTCGQMTPDDSHQKDNHYIKSSRMCAILKKELSLRGMKNWRVRQYKNMICPITVMSPERLIAVRLKTSFNKKEVRRIIAHELDGHVRRHENSQNQPLRCFDLGLVGSNFTEEGLAVLTEERVAGLDPARQRDLFWLSKAIGIAGDADFYEIFNFLKEHMGSPKAWSGTLRIKRGLAPLEKGCFAVDNSYFIGRHQVKKWLEDGGNISHLYVGKVGIRHPIDEWLKEGWLSYQHVPDIWHDNK